MLDIWLEPNTWISLASLAALLIALDIDNVIFLSILTQGLNKEEREKARRIGLVMAMGIRGVLLFAAGYLAQLQQTLFTVFNVAITPQNLVVMAGGLFLLYKSTVEIHNKLEGEHPNGSAKAATLRAALASMLMINLVFSVDSVITAVGMTNSMQIMLAATALSLGLMFIFQQPLSGFIEQHPTLKMLALSFLLLIGMLLVVEGLHVEVPKGYIYFAMSFSLGVELLNIRMRKKGKPVRLHGPHTDDVPPPTV